MRWENDWSERALILPLSLSSDKANQILLRAKVDTGSTFCVFQRRHAELLNIDTETGTRRSIRTATGPSQRTGTKPP